MDDIGRSGNSSNFNTNKRPPANFLILYLTHSLKGQNNIKGDIHRCLKQERERLNLGGDRIRNFESQ